MDRPLGLFSRRAVVQGGTAAAGSLVAFLGCRSGGGPVGAGAGPGVVAGADSRGLGFPSIPAARGDSVILPPGYHYQVLSAWGDPVAPGAPASWRPGDGATGQALCAGMGHDGMALFSVNGRDGADADGDRASASALLAVNYEYTDDGLLSPDGMATWTAEKVALSKSAHGVGILEIAFDGRRWNVVPRSKHGRRITADSLVSVGGPAAGHAWMRTAADPEGRTVRGTFNNCGCGTTPWGTYLTCEENVAPYFVNDAPDIPRLQRRYGVGPTAESWGFRWQEHDERFDAARHPNEPNRHGWVVEIDPYEPNAVPVKRTALGRMAHEGAAVALAPDGRVVVYMGDDDFRSKAEHIYKFVSRRCYRPGAAHRRANLDLLDDGVLYAARFDADGTGAWLPLVHGAPRLTADRGFASQAEILIDARSAADVVGATHMDRPEWISIHPRDGTVYCSLSNNTDRGKPRLSGGKAQLLADAANPRAPNLMGHIIRWREDGVDGAAALTFRWDIFLLAGDPALPEALARGNVRGGVAFGHPDALAFDRRGVLWIATDASTQHMASAAWANIGNNQLLAADPRSGEVRRFMTGPTGCELTGVTFAGDGRTLFVNVQHPGEPPHPHPARNDPRRPMAHSRWPDGSAGTRPRSATIAIRRDDGGVIGA